MGRKDSNPRFLAQNKRITHYSSKTNKPNKTKNKRITVLWSGSGSIVIIVYSVIFENKGILG